ncbi:MAG: hypothetical protein D6776_07805 [Planctomycetota bacterium]|nr:MAG: hypothetical protein D6776_07805 [Planctomycetota bacterium]
MRRRRRRRTKAVASDSLELFLDAMSNAFGCIVLILVLVAAQVQWVSHGRPRPAAQPVQNSAASELAQLRDRLREQLALLQRGRDPETLAALQRRAELEQQRDELARQQRELARRIETMRAALQESRERTRRHEAEIARLEQTLAKLRKRAGYRLRVPRRHEIRKRPVAVFIRGGRYALRFRYDADGDPVGRDPAIDEDAESVALRPGAGEPVRDDPAFWARWEQAMAPFDPGRDYLQFVVWPDGHEAFVTLRDRMVERGYDYDLLLIEEGGRAHKVAGTPTAQ